MEPQKYNASNIELGVRNFSYEKRPMKGIQGVPFINFNKYIPFEKIKDLETSINVSLAKSKNYQLGYIMGSVLPHEKHIFTGPFEAEVLTEIEKYDPTGIHQKNLSVMNKQERRRYLQLALNAVSPWASVLYLKFADFRDKTEKDINLGWSDDSIYFPELKQFIIDLVGPVLKNVGRVMFFLSYPNTPTVCHRDDLDTAHKDHCINIYFKGWRPAYIFDPVNDKKHYLNPGCNAMFFNNRDYHGVDAEPFFNYTLRIDGEFSDKICHELGLKDGFVIE